MLALLVTEREGIVAEVTRLRNQAHQLLVQLDPAYAARIPGLRTQAGLRALEASAAADTAPLPQQRAPPWPGGNSAWVWTPTAQ